MIKCKHITVMLTNKCNLTCSGCYVRQNNDFLDFDLLSTAIIRSLVQLGGSSIGFSGGEPLLYPKVYDAIELASNFGLVTSLVTNGVALNHETARRLQSSGLKKIQISIDAPKKEVNDHLRDVGAFDASVQACEIALRHGFETTIVSVPNNYLMEHFEDMITLAQSIGVEKILLRRNISSKGSTITEQYKKQYLSFLKQVFQRKNANTVSIISCDPLQCLIPFGKNSWNKRDVLAGCSAGITSLAVLPDGTVAPCTRFPLKLGNVRHQSLEEIWNNNKDLDDIRFRRFHGHCKSCSYVNICGGCRAEAMLIGGDYLGSDPMCSLIRSKF